MRGRGEWRRDDGGARGRAGPALPEGGEAGPDGGAGAVCAARPAAHHQVVGVGVLACLCSLPGLCRTWPGSWRPASLFVLCTSVLSFISFKGHRYQLTWFTWCSFLCWSVKTGSQELYSHMQATQTLNAVQPELLYNTSYYLGVDLPISSPVWFITRF